jgi:protein-disulfide isomerase
MVWLFHVQLFQSSSKKFNNYVWASSDKKGIVRGQQTNFLNESLKDLWKEKEMLRENPPDPQ